MLHPTRHKIGHFRDVSGANLLVWYGKTKPNTTQARIHQSKSTTTQNKHKKLVMFSRLLRHPAWKWRGPILVLALHKLVTYLLTYLLRHLPTYLHRWDPHGRCFPEIWLRKASECLLVPPEPGSAFSLPSRIARVDACNKPTDPRKEAAT